MLAPVSENLLELAAIASMLNYSKTFLPVHIKDQLPIWRFLWRMMRDLARAKFPSINAPDQIRQLPVFQAIVQTVFKL